MGFDVWKYSSPRKWLDLHNFLTLQNFYRLWCKGDNTFGSIRLSVCLINTPPVGLDVWKYPSPRKWLHNFLALLIFYRLRSKGDNTFGSICLSICLFVYAFLSELFRSMITWHHIRSKVKFKMLFFYWRGVVDSGTWLCQVQQIVRWNTSPLGTKKMPYPLTPTVRDWQFAKRAIKSQVSNCYINWPLFFHHF